MADTTAVSTPTLAADSPGTLVGDSLPDFQEHNDANVHNFAPVANVMKAAIPKNAHIAKEAKECMQECVSEFISFVTSEASEKAQQEKRRTVNGDDILFALTSLGFENYSEALKLYLCRYREALVMGKVTRPTRVERKAIRVARRSAGQDVRVSGSAEAVV
ncbi:hypothetical protein LTR36_007970 [Oleoguttula mirabilis]|uniref:Transcription factor CBF/NF-Y/archaeal histone domain-containing protein n=1 Tax=Oleoguttula mirabilis TaxID=1507867 RepID=A0AAV9J8U8_9PEZI|nr:hypothetical protein LTR36_007970 [Oleoguttula mirabilis]